VKWVVTQTLFFVAILVSWSFSSAPHGVAFRIVGGLLLASGLALVVTARIAMGSSFTIFPRPRAGGKLVTTGPFRLVRNPIYLGVLLCFAGASLLNSWTGLALTAALAVLWAGKVRVEERYLREQFPEYADYARHVRFRLIPFVY
jgi:protein-S-isoprenylcysteine O-methyltransferase Ste14